MLSGAWQSDYTAIILFTKWASCKCFRLGWSNRSGEVKDADVRSFLCKSLSCYRGIWGWKESSLCPSLVQKCHEQSQNTVLMWRCPLHATITPMFYVAVISRSDPFPSIPPSPVRGWWIQVRVKLFMLKCKLIFFQSFNDVLEFFPLRLLKWLKDCLVFPFLASLCWRATTECITFAVDPFRKGSGMCSF